MRAFFLIATTLLISGYSYSQDYLDLFKITYLNSPFNKTDSVEGPTRVSEFFADATAPVQFKNGRTTFLTGFSYEALTVTSRPEGFNIKAVHSTLIKLGFNQKMGEKWDGTFMLLPKLAGDYQPIGPDHFQIGGVALFKITKREYLKYRFGLYYNSELFGPFFVPIIGFYSLSKNKKFEMNFSLPVHADMRYRFKPWFAAGGTFHAFVRSYYLNPASSVSRQNEYLVKASNELYGYLQFKPAKSFVIETKLGYSFGRRFSTYDVRDRVTFGFMFFRQDDNRVQTNRAVSDGLLFQIRLIYRYDLKKEDSSEANLRLE